MILAPMWKRLSSLERQKYEKQADADKSRYFEEMSKYSGPTHIPNKRRRKSPGAPKRAMSAFLSYSQVMRPVVKAQQPTLANMDISTVLAQNWNSSSEELKRPYVEREIKERLIYHESMAKWKDDRQAESVSIKSSQSSNQHDIQVGDRISSSPSLESLWEYPQQYNMLTPNLVLSSQSVDMNRNFSTIAPNYNQTLIHNKPSNKHRKSKHVSSSHHESTVSSIGNNTNASSINTYSVSNNNTNAGGKQGYASLNHVNFFHAASDPITSIAGPSSDQHAAQMSYFSFSQPTKQPLEKSRFNLNKANETRAHETSVNATSTSASLSAVDGFAVPTSKLSKKRREKSTCTSMIAKGGLGASTRDSSSKRSHTVTTVSMTYDLPLPRPPTKIPSNANVSSVETENYYTRQQQHDMEDSDYTRTMKTLQVLRRLKMCGYYSDDIDDNCDYDDIIKI